MDKTIQDVCDENFSFQKTMNSNFFAVIEKINPAVKNMSYKEFKKFLTKNEDVKITTICRSLNRSSHKGIK